LKLEGLEKSCRDILIQESIYPDPGANISLFYMQKVVEYA
jgi:hypothetical protein